MKGIISLEAAVCGLLAASVMAHPGANVEEERRAMEAHQSNPERRTLASCKKQLEESGYYKRELERRHARSTELRAAAGFAPLHRRELDSVFGSDQPVSEHLARQVRPGCVLDPEVTEGPFWVAGELVRSDILNGTRGVQLHLDINVIDVKTCTPIPNVYVELWGTNSTGVYTGVIAKGNGAGLAAPQEINNNALRGLQPTGSNGTASFLTVVPGHYVGRAVHLHTITHHGARLLPNNTIQGGTISHVGQFYFDQSLYSTVGATAPYNTNQQKLVLNTADQLFNQGKRGGDNPILQTTLLGSKVTDGLYGFIEVGVDPSARRNPQPVNTWTAKGGVPVPGSMWAGYPWNKIRSLLGM